MTRPALAAVPPTRRPAYRVGDLVEHPVCAAVLVDLDPAGRHLWAVLDAPEQPEAVGLLARFAPVSESRVIGRDPAVALAGRALMAEGLS